jgi:hypothetical protein
MSAPWESYVTGLGLLIGAGMGLYGMINPKWASWLVRLRDDPARPGGFAEFRGTYGGLFLGVHATALVLMAQAFHGGGDMGLALGAMLTCAAAWIATSVGRLVSIAVDKTGGGFNYGSVVFELILGVMILALPLRLLGT